MAYKDIEDRRAYQRRYYSQGKWPEQRAKASRRWRSSFRESIFIRDEYRCAYCGVEGIGGKGRKGRQDRVSSDGMPFLTLDHKTPKEMGGSWFDQSNIVTSCWPCNRRKGVTPYAEFKKVMEGEASWKRAQEDPNYIPDCLSGDGQEGMDGEYPGVLP